MKIVKTIIALALPFSLLISAAAQQNGGAKPNGGAPKLVLKSFTHDFGELEAGTPLSYSFKIKNEGTADLLIQAVQPSCGCTASEYARVIPPGKEGEITLAIQHTTGYSGEMSKTTLVVTNDPASTRFNLILRAYFKGGRKTTPVPPPQPANVPAAEVKPPGPFTVSPSDRWVTAAVKGSGTMTKMYLRARENGPVRVKKVVVDGTEFTADLLAIEEGKRYELTISTNPALKPGTYYQTLRLLTDDGKVPEMEIPLELKVIPLVFISPNAILLPRMPIAGEANVGNLPFIYVRKIRDGGLEIKKVSSTLPFLKPQISTEAEGQAYKITLTVDKSKIKSPGEFKGTIRVETNDPETPSTEIPIQGVFY